MTDYEACFRWGPSVGWTIDPHEMEATWHAIGHTLDYRDDWYSVKEWGVPLFPEPGAEFGPVTIKSVTAPDDGGFALRMVRND